MSNPIVRALGQGIRGFANGVRNLGRGSDLPPDIPHAPPNPHMGRTIVPEGYQRIYAPANPGQQRHTVIQNVETGQIFPEPGPSAAPGRPPSP